MPVRVAILGGGMASLATAFHLTNREGWEKDYEVTVYQMGWRLGGKGASGRNAAVHARIEEHGLHIWPGFYYNAFHLMQQCYQELGRDPRQCPIVSWRDAFKEQYYVVDEEQVTGRWQPWSLLAPGNASTPGVGGRLPTVFDYVSMALEMLFNHIFRSAVDARKTSQAEPAEALPWWQRLKRAVLGHVEMSLLLLEALFVRFLRHRWHRLPREVERQRPEQHDVVLGPLDRYGTWLRRRLGGRLKADEAARRFWVLVDLVLAGIRGILRDGLYVHGFDSIDHLDFRDWLRKHGASEWTVDCALIRGLYDFLFAYLRGDPQRPSLAAGVGLRMCIRTAFAYKGAILWKMQAGMGDIVFAPLYEVLQRRGVKFHFFHRVKQLALAGDQRSIERIILGRQVNLCSGGYKPLINVLGLPCWPSTPRYEQLVEGNELQQRQINLESQWTSWPDVEEVSLRAGQDFDVVILGMSLAALPGTCRELIAANSRWQEMVDQVQTVQTISAQLWLKPDLQGLGWGAQSPILSAYADPLETWADMSQTLSREAWTCTERPGSVAYFCGPWPDPPQPVPPSDTSFPAKELDQARHVLQGWLETEIGALWPAAVSPANSQGLNWELLVAPDASTGPDRLLHQFCKVNIEPTDRYVISAAGTTRYRLRVDESGFTNLYLVGDWVRNGMNFGCIESTVVSAMQVSRAMTGQPQVILGETDW